MAANTVELENNYSEIVQAPGTLDAAGSKSKGKGKGCFNCGGKGTLRQRMPATTITAQREKGKAKADQKEDALGAGPHTGSPNAKREL